MARYSFLTVWKLRDTSLDECWFAVKEVETWNQWWRGVSSEIILNGDENGVGQVSKHTFRSVLPYSLFFESEVTVVQKYYCIEAYVRGELQGTGTWLFSKENEIVTIQNIWKVQTEKWWMNFFAPALRPVFRWNHRVIMHWGFEGLAKKLNAKIAGESHQPMNES